MIPYNAARKRGRQNKALGDAFESWLDAQHALAGQLGILAHVEKTQAKTKIVNGQIIFSKAGVADYIGCLEGSMRWPAQYLTVEAKSIDDNRFPRSRVEPNQQEHLTAVAKAGGLALLVVEFRVAGAASIKMVRCAVPWLEVPWKVLRTAESVSMDDLQLWVIGPGTCYLSRWHSGGPRSGSQSVGDARRRIFPRE